MRLPSFLLLALFLLPFAAFAGQLEDGLTSYKSGDWSVALKLLKPLAEKGDAQAQVTIGQIYGSVFAESRGAAWDLGEAAKWWRKAADQGNIEAQVEMGEAYEFGDGVTQNYAEALRWYRLAADRGNAEGQYLVGNIYEKGLGVKRDRPKAIKWLRLAADQGLWPAQHDLGEIYMRRKTYLEAMKWFLKAANQGDVESTRLLGQMYEKGQGVKRNGFEALRWYRKVEDHGVLPVPAPDWIDGMYERNHGTNLPNAEVAKYWRVGAGLIEMEISLGGMYEKGESVKQDWQEAYFRYSLPAIKEWAPKLAVRAAKHLTSDQIAAVNKRVKEWGAGFPKAGPN